MSKPDWLKNKEFWADTNSRLLSVETTLLVSLFFVSLSLPALFHTLSTKQKTKFSSYIFISVPLARHVVGGVHSASEPRLGRPPRQARLAVRPVGQRGQLQQQPPRRQTRRETHPTGGQPRRKRGRRRLLLHLPPGTGRTSRTCRR